MAFCLYYINVEDSIHSSNCILESSVQVSHYIVVLDNTTSTKNCLINQEKCFYFSGMKIFHPK